MRLAIATVFSLIFLLVADANAQGTPAGVPSAATNIGGIQGRLADSTSGQAIATGSITSRRQLDTSFAGGALPKADGTFAWTAWRRDNTRSAFAHSAARR